MLNPKSSSLCLLTPTGSITGNTINNTGMQYYKAKKFGGMLTNSRLPKLPANITKKTRSGYLNSVESIDRKETNQNTRGISGNTDNERKNSYSTCSDTSASVAGNSINAVFNSTTSTAVEGQTLSDSVNAPLCSITTTSITQKRQKKSSKYSALTVTGLRKSRMGSIKA